MNKKVILFAILLVGLFAVSVSAQSKVHVRFAKGTSSATVKGTVTGYKYIDYIVRAKSGQTMTVNLTSANTACNFAIFYSDMKEIEDANGVQESTRNVDVDDDYIVRVLLPRSAARRKESANFSLKIAITN
ncbi:MAG: hypothetical protein K1X72_17700 [Pyrinomonadaceae bacterium]|nr:hypothetical protein [Pyrinomonadaceae bacterium]